ncbi:hypothetical protein [Mesorhizobium sp.]|nr:hypothetical protein [Mesorhizobium sp.]RWI18570.1 MAG: hypothetical protein EOQ92_22585 [Mesorhizobium sp.]RWK44556.1 MAG: hypothetical protein EOR46_01195 [Mesorhizobium sp.]RWK46303.1 MAG: hypothetical protein EOR47_26905 [Mesorhizobium sp.]RWK82863.1 MAG: hypothetical protein EOR51_09460 [Mesorhizobium sp.]RWL16835.1 MAG: hypothetical protein EOR56_01195 [Mesorhizobium sp.]
MNGVTRRTVASVTDCSSIHGGALDFELPDDVPKLVCRQLGEGEVLGYFCGCDLAKAFREAFARSVEISGQMTAVQHIGQHCSKSSSRTGSA